MNLSVASKEGRGGRFREILQSERVRSVDFPVTERSSVESLRDIDAVVGAERADLAFRRCYRGADVVLDVDREFLLVLIFRPTGTATSEIDSAQSFRTQEIRAVLVRGTSDNSQVRGRPNFDARPASDEAAVATLIV